MVEFAWADIKSYSCDNDGGSFNFEYVREGKKARLVKVFTVYVSTCNCMYWNDDGMTASACCVYSQIMFCEILLLACVQHKYLHSCFNRVKAELEWQKEVGWCYRPNFAVFL